MLQRLMSSVVNAMQDFRLDGVTVNWAQPKPGCESPNDLRLLGELLKNIRSTFNSQGLQQAITSVVLDINTGNEHLVDGVFNDVMYFFLTTHLVGLPSTPTVQHLCADITSAVLAVLQLYASTAPRASVRQLGITEYTAPLGSEGSVDPATGVEIFEPSMQYAPIYSGCAYSSFCRDDSAAGSCIVHKAVTGQHATRLVVSNAFTLEQRAYLYSHPCVLVLGLDYDSFVDQCGRLFRRYPLLEHLHDATGGQTVTSRAIVDGAPL
ncbi:hypothetical protein V5799_011100 [Amblyomma americanum]|uniref:GH18 domain-containing protein n=1 Tax=Amblyomma americanum TaxID=6943 RepID=A0AAQ4EHU3_AMBAM